MTTDVSATQPVGRAERLAQTFFGTAFAAIAVYLFIEYTLQPFAYSGALPPVLKALMFRMESSQLSLAALALSAMIGVIATVRLEVRRSQAETLERLHYWNRVIVRYFLAYIFFTYGFSKVFHDQFSTALSMLDTPLGEVSGISLTWRFFGYSYAYALFVASAQIFAGVLFFFRRTTTLAALILLPVISNIVFINFAFHIPVKLYSIIYLLMTCFLLFPDVRRLKAVVWDDQPFGRKAFAVPNFSARGAALLKFGIAAVLLVVPIAQMHHAYVIFTRSSTPLAGTWVVETYEINGKIGAESDPSTWKKLYVDSDSRITIRSGARRLVSYHWSLDVAKQSLKMTSMSGRPYFEGTYQLEHNSALTLDGTSLNAPIRVTLTRMKEGES